MKKNMMKIILMTALLASASFCTPSRDSVLQKYKDKISDSSNPIVIMQTSKGDIYVELFQKAAPETVKNFLGLANGSKEYRDAKTGNMIKGKYFDGLIFHGVIPNFMIQGGDIMGNGRGGPGYQFKDEINPVALGLDKIKAIESQGAGRDLQMMVAKKLNITSQEEFNKKKALFEQEVKKAGEMSVMELNQKSGYEYDMNLPSVPVKKYTLAMANAGPNTNGSQFFINVADNDFLNGKHTVFGRVFHGTVVVDEISNTPRESNDKPKTDVLIKKIIELK